MNSALHALETGPARKLAYGRAGHLPGQSGVGWLIPCPEAMHTESRESFSQNLVTWAPEPEQEPEVPFMNG